MKLYESINFQRRKQELQKIRDLYMGKRSVVISDKYLFPLEIEKTSRAIDLQLRINRMRRTRYSNYLKALVSIWEGITFEGFPAVSDFAIENIEIDNINGTGADIKTLAKDVYKDMLLYGRFFLEVESFSKEVVDLASLADERRQGVRPYIRRLDPLGVVDYSIEAKDPSRLGELNFIRYEIEEEGERRHSQEVPKIATKSIEYIWFPDFVLMNVYTINGEQGLSGGVQDWTKIKETQIPLSKIPVAYHITDSSWGDDISEQMIKHLNLESVYDNILYFHAHPLKYFTGFNNGTDENEIEMSEYTALFLPDGATAGVIPPQDFPAMKARMQEVRDDLFKLGMRQLRQLGGNSKQTQSAETLKEERGVTTSIVDSDVSILNDVINRALSIFLEFKQIENKDGEELVTFSTKVDVGDLQKILALFLGLKDELALLPETKKEFVKTLINEVPTIDGSTVNEEIAGVTSLNGETVIGSLGGLFSTSNK
jgi:hypothetical protein